MKIQRYFVDFTSGIITTVTLATGQLGRGQIKAEDISTAPLGSGPWCSIKTGPGHLKTKEIIVMVLAGKGWEIGTYIFSAALYMLLIVFTWRRVSTSDIIFGVRLYRHISAVAIH